MILTIHSRRIKLCGLSITLTEIISGVVAKSGYTMPRAWIEKTTTQRVKEWAFSLLKSHDVVFVGYRQHEGYPVVAEIEVMDADRLRFKSDLDKALRIIMIAPGAPIDDPDLDFEIDDIIFHVECYD